MTSMALGEKDIEDLVRLAKVLIPPTAIMPGVDAIERYEDLLRSAVRACGHPEDQIRAAIGRIPADGKWDSAKAFASEAPGLFHIASEMVSAAYYMAPAVLKALNFPTDRRQPAGQEEFADEYLTGILNAVIERGPRFRDPTPDSH